MKNTLQPFLPDECSHRPSRVSRQVLWSVPHFLEGVKPDEDTAGRIREFLRSGDLVGVGAA